MANKYEWGNEMFVWSSHLQAAKTVFNDVGASLYTALSRIHFYHGFQKVGLRLNSAQRQSLFVYCDGLLLTRSGV